jgi:hypothetical protein
MRDSEEVDRQVYTTPLPPGTEPAAIDHVHHGEQGSRRPEWRWLAAFQAGRGCPCQSSQQSKLVLTAVHAGDRRRLTGNSWEVRSEPALGR